MNLRLFRDRTFFVAALVAALCAGGFARDAAAQGAEEYVKWRAKNFIALVWREEWERALALMEPDAVKTQSQEEWVKFLRQNFGMKGNKHLKRRDGTFSVYAVGDLKFNSDGVSATVLIEFHEPGADDGKKLLPETATVPMRWVWKHNNWYFAP
jgi:hypothetical protein